MELNTQIHRAFVYMWLDDVLTYLKPQSLWSKLWWKFMPGVVVKVKWPRGWYPLDESGSVDCETSDPNTAYRWYLEQYVGKQGWDWNWKIGSYENDSLCIKLRSGKDEYADMIALKWG